MFKDKLSDWYYDLRDIVSRNRKIVMPLFLFVCVVITVGVSFGLRRANRSLRENTETEEVELSAEEIELELNAYPAVNELVETYYEAVADGDADTIEEISLIVSDEERIRIQEMGTYIDTYTSIDVYTKTGPIENSYIAYVVTRLLLVDHDWEIPGLQTLYICIRDNGEYYINNSETQPEEVSTYIQLASLQDDVVDLNNQVAAEYNELLAEDEELSEYLDQMASVIDISVGQQLAALNEDSSEEEESVVYVVATASDINIRKSASADGTKIGTAQEGDQFQLVEELSDGWTEILFNGQTAYVKSDYVTIVDFSDDSEESSSEEESSEEASSEEESSEEE